LDTDVKRVLDKCPEAGEKEQEISRDLTRDQEDWRSGSGAVRAKPELGGHVVGLE
jgi:hypothetical protein